MRKKRVLLGVVAGLLASGAASALPWDIDMVDAYFFKAYEWVMMTLPDGVVSQNRYVQQYDIATPEGQALTNPLPDDAATQAKGQVLYNVYCTPCHGATGAGEGTVMDNTEGKKRFPIPVINVLSGPNARVSRQTDGHVYLTIRNGSRSKIMPAYDAAMDDEEMWAIVRYVRTLNGAAYQAPTPAVTTPPAGN